MITVFAVVALIGLILFAVGAVLFIFVNPPKPVATILMVVGALVYAVAQIFLISDSLLF
jgi:hypothetical protein